MGNSSTGKYCQILHGKEWVRGQVLLEPDEAKGVKGWKVLLFVCSGVEKYVSNAEEIKFEEGE